MQKKVNIFFIRGAFLFLQEFETYTAAGAYYVYSSWHTAEVNAGIACSISFGGIYLVTAESYQIESLFGSHAADCHYAGNIIEYGALGSPCTLHLLDTCIDIFLEVKLFHVCESIRYRRGIGRGYG